MTSIWWIRRDLRLSDNLALQAALRAGPVLPVFLLDPHFDSVSPRRRNFLYEGLRALGGQLQARGSRLTLRRGEPIEALRRLLAETGADAIYAERDTTPYALARDTRAARTLPLTLVHGQTVHPPEQVQKADGSPYTIYTPYSRAWKSLLPANLALLPAPEHFPAVEFPTSVTLPESTPEPLFPAGEAEAQRRLAQFANHLIADYADQRNRLDLDGTSALSPYLRFGMLGMRQAVHAARQAQAGTGSEVWLNELIWREFYIQILYHFPRVARESFNPALANIP